MCTKTDIPKVFFIQFAVAMRMFGLTGSENQMLKIAQYMDRYFKITLVCFKQYFDAHIYIWIETVFKFSETHTSNNIGVDMLVGSTRSKSITILHALQVSGKKL